MQLRPFMKLRPLMKLHVHERQPHKLRPLVKLRPLMKLHVHLSNGNCISRCTSNSNRILNCDPQLMKLRPLMKLHERQLHLALHIERQPHLALHHLINCDPS